MLRDHELHKARQQLVKAERSNSQPRADGNDSLLSKLSSGRCALAWLVCPLPSASCTCLLHLLCICRLCCHQNLSSPCTVGRHSEDRNHNIELSAMATALGQARFWTIGSCLALFCFLPVSFFHCFKLLHFFVSINVCSILFCYQIQC